MYQVLKLILHYQDMNIKNATKCYKCINKPLTFSVNKPLVQI